MLRSVLALAVIAAVCVIGERCGDPCSNNDQCKTLECSHCDPKTATCQPGRTCGGQCDVNFDCDQLSNCTHCSNNTCSSYCGQACESDAFCRSVHCDACVDKRCTLFSCGKPCNKTAVQCSPPCSMCDIVPGQATGTCSALCGARCYSDGDCPAPCPYCDATERTCQSSP